MNTLQKIEHMPVDFSQEKLDLLKNTVCKGASNDEFQLFLHVCRKTGLDPFMKQIYSIPRGGARTIQTSIDGLRLIADRTNRYSPGKECSFVYNDKGAIISATAYIKKMTHDGTWHEVSATAYFDEYAQTIGTFWKKMPHVMLAKCAEAIALRKAFPAEMSGLYSDDEMQQAESKVVEIKQESEEVISHDQLCILNAQLDQLITGRDDLMKFLEMTAKISDLAQLPKKLFVRITATLKKKIDQQNEMTKKEVEELVSE